MTQKRREYRGHTDRLPRIEVVQIGNTLRYVDVESGVDEAESLPGHYSPSTSFALDSESLGQTTIHDLLEALRASLLPAGREAKRAPGAAAGGFVEAAAGLGGSVLEQLRALSGAHTAAMENAQQLASRLDELDLHPNSIDLAADGSIMMYLYSPSTLEGGSHRRYAVFGSSDTGLAVMLKDRQADGPPSGFDIETPEEIAAAIAKAIEFVQE